MMLVKGYFDYFSNYHFDLHRSVIIYVTNKVLKSPVKPIQSGTHYAVSQLQAKPGFYLFSPVFLHSSSFCASVPFSSLVAKQLHVFSYYGLLCSVHVYRNLAMRMHHSCPQVFPQSPMLFIGVSHHKRTLRSIAKSHQWAYLACGAICWL